MTDQFLLCIPALGFLLLGFAIGWTAKPQYKRDKRGRFTK